MPQSFVSLPVHLVFSTQNREALIHDDIQSRLYEYMGGTLRAQKSKLIAAEACQTMFICSCCSVNN